jgi:hypothetical protein
MKKAFVCVLLFVVVLYSFPTFAEKASELKASSSIVFRNFSWYDSESNIQQLMERVPNANLNMLSWGLP